MFQRIKVLIRTKPLIKEQIKMLTSIDYANHIISINKPSEKIHNALSKDNNVRSFAFSKIFIPSATQEEIYQQCAFSLVENVLEGYNGTIFVYGQTGSGKTFTIMGGKEYMQKKRILKNDQKIHDKQQSKKNEENKYIQSLRGIIPRSFNQIITVTKSQKDKKHLIQCSFIEIYNQNVHDLLGEDTKCNLSLKQNANKGLVIEGIKTFLAKSVDELEIYLKIGYKNRSVRQTVMNKQSSRSHCIFTIRIQEQTTDQFGNAKFKVGKLNLVDLAGSERQKKTNIKDDGMKQATKINLSLSALGKVINCLSNYRENQKMYIPYRDSKLTRILQDSLGGNTKTVMIATVSQDNINSQQTLSTLIYASRAKYIQNKPILNEDPKDVLLRQYVQQIQKLKELLVEKQRENQGLKITTLKFNSTMRQSLQTFQEQEIKKKIEDLQKIVEKQNVQEDEENKMQLEKIEILKKKIKIQEQRELYLETQKKKKQQELLSIQKVYKSLNQEVGILRGKFTDLKAKYLVKSEELQDFRKVYNDQKEEFHYILTEKDKQIKKLQKLLQTVLQEQTYHEVVGQDQRISQNTSNYSQNKFISHFNVEKKAKVKLNDLNLYKHQSDRRKPLVQQEIQRTRSKARSTFKIQINSQQNLDGRNYQSEHQRKVHKDIQSHPISSLTNMKQLTTKDKRERIRKVDSLISFKNIKRDASIKLPFITQIKKLNSSRNKDSISIQKSSNDYSSKISLDIAKIKDQIINELKYNKKRVN